MSTRVIERVKADDRFRNGWRAHHLVKTAMRNEPVRLVVQLDDSRAHLVVSNLCVANARYFGGGMKIAPDAKLTDGKFDVSVSEI
jgi:diacylglycerol kinase family enzyme